MPARKSTVLRARKSRTTTLPRRTFVMVPSQRSETVQSVPRTVAELWRPRVRKRPLARPRRRRIVRRAARREDRERVDRRPALLRLAHERKLAPLSRSPVSPFALRLRDCTT